MRVKTLLIVVGILLLFLLPAGIFVHHLLETSLPAAVTHSQIATSPTPAPVTSPLAINRMRQKQYTGGNLKVITTLPDGYGYHRYLMSYPSDTVRVEGLLTVPDGIKPKNGWPAILLNHGYVPPPVYVAATNYAGIVNAFASHGYVVFMPDYRGNGQSEGTPEQPYVSPVYVTDSLNGLASLESYKDSTGRIVDPQRIGVFGHSMGGSVTLHDLIISPVFKAGVIWAGSVGSYPQLLPWWDRRFANGIIAGNDLDTYYTVKKMVEEHGTPQTNPRFWHAIDPTLFLSDIQASVLLQVGTADEVVPTAFTTGLYEKLKQAGKTTQLITYPNADHNLAPDTDKALEESVSFFDKYLKK